MIRPTASPRLLDSDIKPETTVLIANSADADAWRCLVFEFDDLALCRRCIGGERHKQIASDALLHCESGTAVNLAAQQGIDRELRNAGDLFNAVGQLTTEAGSDHRFRSERTGRGISGLGLRRFSEYQQIDDVGWRQSRF